MLYKARNEAIKLFEEYFSVVSNEGKGCQISTLKQLLERLPIALAQVKAGNNSKSLLNEIRNH